MVITVTESVFVDAFRQSESRKDSFSYDGLSALFAYLDSMDEDTGISTELDIVAIDCEYSEYESAEKACEEYRLLGDVGEREEDEDEGDWQQRCIDELQNHTSVIEFDGGVIIQQF